MKQISIYISDDPRQIPSVDYEQEYIEEEMTLIEVLGALEAAKQQVIAQMAMKTQKKEER